MLAAKNIIAFVATTQPDKAKYFYGDVLGLKFESEDPFALVLTRMV